MSFGEIIAYAYRADEYCPRCIVRALPTGEGEAYDGWALASGVRMTTEENLSEIAAAFGIDRMDERSFDSGDFPKVIFADSETDSPYHCAVCGDLIPESLTEDGRAYVGDAIRDAIRVGKRSPTVTAWRACWGSILDDPETALLETFDALPNEES